MSDDNRNENHVNEERSTKQKRGFAVISPERLRAISRLGGMAAHQRGTAHEWSREEAVEAGRKGGRAAHQK